MTHDAIKRWTLYVLRLQDGKFYVGITSRTPEKRMQEHVDGVRVAYWTAKHKPLAVIHTEDLGVIEKSKAEKRENKMTRALMRQRGINNVRGGDLTDTEEYVKRFGWLYLKSQWEIITIVILQTLAIIYLLIDKYLI